MNELESPVDCAESVAVTDELGDVRSEGVVHDGAPERRLQIQRASQLATASALAILGLSSIVGRNAVQSGAQQAAAQRRLPESGIRAAEPQRLAVQAQGSLTPTPIVLGGMFVSPMNIPLDFAIQHMPLIAEVRVIAIHDALFNTGDGLPPPVPTVENVLEDDDAGWDIYRIAELEVLNVYRGVPNLEYIVTALHGGEVGGYASYRSGMTADTLQIGSQAMMFASGMYDGLASPNATLPWLRQAGERLQALEGAGFTAQFEMLAELAYVYDTSSGLATSYENGDELAIVELRAIVGAGTP